MPSFGIMKNSYKWFASYLKDRTQMVKINDNIGKKATLNCGVTQGSVLGPVLFIMYINSICNMQIDGSITTYADDTCLVFSDNSWDLVHNKSVIETNRIIQKLNSIKLTINYQKTTCMAFSIYSYSNFTFQELIVCNNDNNTDNTTYSKINRVTKVRYLGLTFDFNMRWHVHIQNITTRLRTIIFKLYNIRNFISKDIMRIVYMSLYQSICQYGIIVWGGATENILRPLITQQNKVIRICLNKCNKIGSTNKIT
jgi:hypothetical protein